MSTGHTSETRQAWRCGEYRVELAAPRLWVVTREIARTSGRTKVEVEATTGSLKTARGLIAKLHRKHCAQRSLMVRLVTLIVAVPAAAWITSIESSLAVPAVLTSVLLAGRTLVTAIDLIIGRSWEQVSHTYQ